MVYMAFLLDVQNKRNSKIQQDRQMSPSERQMTGSFPYPQQSICEADQSEYEFNDFYSSILIFSISNVFNQREVPQRLVLANCLFSNIVLKKAV